MEIELTDYFTIGVDLEAYSSMDELVDKCAYYLAHDEERKQIAKNGYDKLPAMPIPTGSGKCRKH